MGNIFSTSISCDAIFSRCLDCALKRTSTISELQHNLHALETELPKLLETRNDVMRRVNTEEQNQMKRTDQVQGWLSRVASVETEVEELMRESSQEIEKLCLGGCCSKNCKSSYKYGKKVSKTLQVVATLKGEAAFEVLAERVPEAAVDERPTQPTIVGLESTLDEVWRCLEEEQVGIIGIYGMGGVGKTTLLTQINNKFVEIPNDFDLVMWVVVSKDLRIEKIQEKIGQRIGLFTESWNDRSMEEKASDIFKILRKKKLVLLLDDIWERVDLTKVGIPFPGSNCASKIIFTTRFLDVCGQMEVDKKFKVECLGEEEAWKLFSKKVGQETLDSHPDILELAKVVANECGGLPLALIATGRAMTYKKTPEEWKYAIQVLRRASSRFPGMEKEVYPLLKFSYDSLPSDKIRSCLLYCCLFTEDFRILKTKLIDYWFCENFLDVYDQSEVHNHGYYIIGVLVHACLLEEEEERGEKFVKMHDVIRDMALWIACEIKEEKQNFLVDVASGLIEAPMTKKWEGIKRISLMENKIEELSNIPTCSDLLTLFLNKNNLKMISSGFFQFMPSLKVLNLSDNKFLTKLPSGISNLVSLQHLDLAWSKIKELPLELKGLVNLKCLSLEFTHDLCTIPHQVISNFPQLHVLRMIGSGYNVSYQEVQEDSVLFGGGEYLVDELLCLKKLNVLSITLKTSNALQRFLGSQNFQSNTHGISLKCLNDSESLNVQCLANLKHLHRLEIVQCELLEELKIENVMIVQNSPATYSFHSIHRFQIVHCPKVRDLTWLVFVPNLKYLYVTSCQQIEEIICKGKLGEDQDRVENLNPFAKLHFLHLNYLPKLKSVYWKALPFPHLDQFFVRGCPELKKLPLDCNSTKGQKLAIKGEKNWWKELQWEDEATRNFYTPYFRSRRIWN